MQSGGEMPPNCSRRQSYTAAPAPACQREGKRSKDAELPGTHRPAVSNCSVAKADSQALWLSTSWHGIRVTRLCACARARRHTHTHAHTHARTRTRTHTHTDLKHLHILHALRHGKQRGGVVNMLRVGSWSCLQVRHICMHFLGTYTCQSGDVACNREVRGMRWASVHGHGRNAQKPEQRLAMHAGLWRVAPWQLRWPVCAGSRKSRTTSNCMQHLEVPMSQKLLCDCLATA